MSEAPILIAQLADLEWQVVLPFFVVCLVMPAFGIAAMIRLVMRDTSSERLLMLAGVYVAALLALIFCLTKVLDARINPSLLASLITISAIAMMWWAWRFGERSRRA